MSSACRATRLRNRKASSGGVADWPLSLENGALRIPTLDGNRLCAIGLVVEAEDRIFRKRYAAFHRKDQIGSLAHLDLLDVMRGNIEMRHLVHLHAGGVGMADHDLRFALARSLRRKLAIFHLAEICRGFVHVIARRRRAAARGLDEFDLGVERSITRF